MNVEKYQHITDAELLQNFNHDQNNQWLGILLERYTLLLLGVCMKYLKNEEEAKDAVQQIFLKSITELQKYRIEYFRSWIYMVARNHCLMKLRDRSGKLTTVLTENLTGSITEKEHDEKLRQLERDRALELMENALKELSREQHVCIILFYLKKNLTRKYQTLQDTLF